MYKWDLALNNPQWLMCHKTTNQSFRVLSMDQIDSFNDYLHSVEPCAQKIFKKTTTQKNVNMNVL